MKTLRIASNLLSTVVFVIAMAVPSAHAGWVWSPETGWVSTSGAVRDSPSEQLMFSVGLFEAGDFEGARKEFKKLLKSYGESREAVEAQYYIALCREEESDYYQAFLEYRKTIQTYPSTKHFDEILERQYKIGNYFLGGNKRKLFGTAAILPARDKAIEIFQAIVEDGPFSEHGELSQYKLGLAHLAMADYEEAVNAFEQLINNYPESVLVDDSRYQIALASLKGTFKPGYDQSATDSAIQELQTFLTRYTDSELLDDAKERLIELKERRAEHEFQVAQFYERRGEFLSAMLYYSAIVDDFAKTSWAPEAAARIQILETKL